MRAAHGSQVCRQNSDRAVSSLGAYTNRSAQGGPHITNKLDVCRGHNAAPHYRRSGTMPDAALRRVDNFDDAEGTWDLVPAGPSQ